MQDGYTALTRAAAREHTDIVKLLVQHGADTNHQNKVSRDEGVRLWVGHVRARVVTLLFTII